jgi:hypothetical protein
MEQFPLRFKPGHGPASLEGLHDLFNPSLGNRLAISGAPAL